MSWLIATLLGLGLSDRAARIGAFVIVCVSLAAALVAAFQFWLGARESSAVANHEAAVQVDIERRGRKADAQLHERQGQADAAASVAREEFDNATSNMPAEGLTRRQRLDLCRELHDTGTDTSVLAQCRGLSN